MAAISAESMLSVTSALSRLLEGVEENGGHADASSIWGYYLMDHDELYTSTKQSCLRRRTLSATHAVLSCLAQLAQKQIEEIDRMSAQNGPGHEFKLSSLPEEILQIVFSSITQEKHESTRSLLQVDRRFRRVALDTPALWTRICSLQPRTHIDAFIRCSTRNHGTPLSLCFCERSAEELQLLATRSDDFYVNLPNFILLLAPLTHQWDEIRFHACGSNDFDYFLQAGYVPSSVQNIQISGWDGLRSTEMFENFFETSWLHLQPLVFKGINSISSYMTSALKTVDIIFDDSNMSWSMSSIIEALSEIESAENLAITWKQCGKERLEDDRGDAPVFELPAIKSLKAQVLGDSIHFYHNTHNFAKMFANLDFPSLRKLSIIVNFIPVQVGNQLLEQLIWRHGVPDQDGQGLPLLRSFSFRMQVTPYDMDCIKDLKKDLLGYMPGLQRLYIEGPGMLEWYYARLPALTWKTANYGGINLFPRMKSIVFSNCLRIDRWMLKVMRHDIFPNTLHRPPAYFEKIIISQCPLLTDPSIVSGMSSIGFGDTLIIKDECDDADFPDFEFKDTDVDDEE